jgi:hypothetical protein
MLRFLTVGMVGIIASVAGMGISGYVSKKDHPSETDGTAVANLTQLKTEMTGIPVVTKGEVSGYLVFQISSTVDTSKLMTKEFDVAPYMLDAAIRASYESTEDGALDFDASFFEKLAQLVLEEANRKLRAEVVIAVNVQQFNFVPKGEVRGSVLAGSQH